MQNTIFYAQIPNPLSLSDISSLDMNQIGEGPIDQSQFSLDLPPTELFPQSSNSNLYSNLYSNANANTNSNLLTQNPNHNNNQLPSPPPSPPQQQLQQQLQQQPSYIVSQSQLSKMAESNQLNSTYRQYCIPSLPLPPPPPPLHSSGTSSPRSSRRRSSTTLSRPSFRQEGRDDE